MPANKTTPTRRSVLKAAGAAVGVAFGASASGAAKCMEVGWDAPAWDECPPTGSRDSVVEAGAFAVAECSADGTRYYSAFDGTNSGYVPEAYVIPCQP